MAMPLAGTQAPGVYRLKVGAFEVTVLSDGNLAIEPADVCRGRGGRRQAVGGQLMPTRDAIPTCVNEWLVNTGGKLVLVDAGGGASFVPTLGKMHSNLAAAGVDPPRSMPSSSPTCIRTTSRACSRADGKMAFPNAVVHVPPTSTRSGRRTKFAPRRRTNSRRSSILPWRRLNRTRMPARCRCSRTARTFAPGITAAAMPGHTVGHSMVRVSSDGSDFLIWGDIVHCAALQFPEPRTRHRRSTPIRRWRSPTARRCSTWWRPTGCCSPAHTYRSPVWATPPNPVPVTLTCR